VTAEKPKIILIGTFPPPTHGMSVVNRAILDQLKSMGATPVVIDVSTPNLGSCILLRLCRTLKVFFAMVRFASMLGLRDAKLYMSVSGGLGQIYEIYFAMMARLSGMKLFMHHHSFAYLYKRKLYTQILINVAGSSCVHVTLSKKMARQLKILYKAPDPLSISNVVFQPCKKVVLNKSCKELTTIGFISNISSEKGVFEFLDLMTAIDAEKLSIKALLAGPFQNPNIEKAVYNRLAHTQSVQYVGPKYGVDKDNFFDQIDVIVFPTRYFNEAEPLIVLEAMNRGIPIIAYGRGCIPEIVGENCGKIIDMNDDFLPIALEQIKTWQSDLTEFEAASLATSHQFLETYIRNNQHWLDFLANLIGISFDVGIRGGKARNFS
jgi:glycosyltransferase involved in cell wall biosynthesis